MAAMFDEESMDEAEFEALDAVMVALEAVHVRPFSICLCFILALIQVASL